MPRPRYLALPLLCLVIPTLLADHPAHVFLFPLRAQSVTIVAPGIENVGKVVADRISRRANVPIGSETADLTIRIGVAGEDKAFDKKLFAHALRMPGKTRPAPEAFAIKTVLDVDRPTIIAVGADRRGALYAAGEVLRRLQYLPEAIEVPAMDVSDAPAYRFRGSSANQGGTMRRATGARAWTQDELFDVVLDYALAGANCFYTEDNGGPLYDFVKSFGLMTTTGARPNQLNRPFPPEWKAGGREGWEGPHWVCPNIPEARRALLDQWRADFGRRADHDVMRFYAGDPGGCTDARCTPWGKSFVHLSEEMAAIWLESHPDSIVLIANQGLDNAGDKYIFDYLSASPRTWLYGLCYGPGSNAMSPYFRDVLRDDLFEYPGDGPVNRYLAETLRALPSDKAIVHYSDITHWISAQYMVQQPEPHMIRAYGRRTFHARPAAMYRIFKAIMPFSDGDIIYSEGYHDEFHQFMWNRLLWNPNQTLDDVLYAYCAYHFGEAAAPLMVEALKTMEGNLETPVVDNPNIDRYYSLVKEAGAKIPSNLLQTDHRWHMHMQHAALDKHLQLRLRRQLEAEKRVAATLAGALEKGPLDEGIDSALAILRNSIPAHAMDDLREEARVLGEETDKRFGIRDIGYFRLERPLRDIAGHTALLEKARAAKTRAEKRALIGQCLEAISRPTRPGNFFS